MTHAKNKKLSEFGRKGAKIRWDNKHSGIIARLKNKNSNNHLLLRARLCGFLAGDGTVKIRKEKRGTNNYEVNFFPDHVSLIDPYLTSFQELYERKPSIKKEGKLFRIRIKCKIACLDLIKIGKFGIHNWEVPLAFLNTDRLKREWLRSYFDSEAHVSKRQIQVQSVNKNGIYQVKNILEGLGIQSNIYKYERKNKNWSTNYILCIMRKNARKIYLGDIGFNHKLKLKKLKEQFIATVA